MRKIFYFLVSVLLTVTFGNAIASVTDVTIALAFVALSFLVSAFTLFSKGEFSKGVYNVLGTIASGVGVPTSINGYKGIPQFLCFEVSTIPQSIRISVNGRFELVNLDTAGITALMNPRVIGRATNSFIIPLANGLMTDLSMDITIVNNVAAAFDILGINKQAAPVDAPGLFTSLSQTINQGTSTEFSDFKYLALPSIGATDFLSATASKRKANGAMVDGEWNARLEPAGIRSFLSQYESQAVTVKNAIDNYNNEWQSLWFTPVATQRVYVQRLVSAQSRGAVNAIG